MKRLVIPLFIIALSLQGCIDDYHFDTDMYKRKIVVESFINPDSVIKVSVAWNKPGNDTSAVKYIDGAHVQIEEDGVVIVSGTTDNGTLLSNVYPAAGKSYHLSVMVEGEEEVTAETSIPPPADISFTTREKLADKYRYVTYDGIEYVVPPTYELRYIATDVSDIVIPTEVSAVWIEAYASYDNGIIYGSETNELFSSSPYFDQVNSLGNNSDVLERESSIMYERGFIRIQRQALSLALPFTFTMEIFYRWSHFDYVEIDGVGEWITESGLAEQFLLYLTSPSDEYDKYRRSAVKQELAQNIILFFTNDPVNVFSNIHNGVGIFAGYNTKVVAVPIDNPLQ